MSIILMPTPHELAFHLAQKAQKKRISLNWTQQTLSLRSGVSYGVLKKFERTGAISLGSLLKIAFALGELDGFQNLFEIRLTGQFSSLDDLIESKTKEEKERKRARGN